MFTAASALFLLDLCLAPGFVRGEVAANLHDGDGRSLAAGTSHVCSLKAGDRSPVCWGWDAGGQVSKAPTGVRYRDIVAGTRHGCGLREADSTVECWGGDIHGEQQYPKTERFVNLVSGYWHICGVRQDRTVMCWGSNIHGQSNAPEGVRFNNMSTGASHSCGIQEDPSRSDGSGPVRCWGKTPQAAPPKGFFTDVSSGEYHSCGIEDGAVRCWGLDHYGQSTPPKAAIGKRRLKSTVAGGDHSCALFEDDGTAICWGLAKDGQATPPAGVSYRYLVAGVYYTCGLQTKDQTVECWGRNFEKQTAVPDNHRAEL